jgi:ABC-2 type transport system ATP-binding protein
MIQLSGVTKRYKSLTAVQQLSLEVPKGSFLGLLGPNGAGKTTLVEMIEGLQVPDDGEIRIDGLNWKEHGQQLRKMVGLSLQETRFMEKVTVRETLDLFASFYNLPRSRSDEVMEMVELQEKSKTYTVQLSGGQRQRLALAVALLHKPALLLLDEPTTGLDPHARREIWYLLQQLHQEEKTTLVLTTHYMEEASYLCDRIVIMDKGQVLADGNLRQLLNTFAPGEYIEFKTPLPLPLSKLEKLPGFMSLLPAAEPGFVRLKVKESAIALPPLLSLLQLESAELLSLECRKSTLDDLFLNLTGRRLEE